jgi:hypothetical protein
MPTSGSSATGPDSTAPVLDAATLSSAGPAILRFGGIAAWSYICFVFFYQETLFGVYLGAAVTLLAVLVGSTIIVIVPVVPRFRRILSPGGMLNLGLALTVSVFTIVIADTAYSVYANVVSARARAPLSDAVRESDYHVWHGELMPRLYYPTGRQFFLYKPNARTTAETYGEFYNSSMLGSRTLADSVLELRTVSYAIGPHGLRDTTSLAGSATFALGDSFVFGYATDEPKTWTRLLAAAEGAPVYNLGVSNTGPKAQLLLLEHLLETQPDSMRIERLLWMIFEGNDLENDYGEFRPPVAAPTADLPLNGTVAQVLASVPGRVKNQSIIRKALDGELTATVRSAAVASDDHRTFDGIALPFPLYHSTTWGYRLFSAADIREAAKPLDYVLTHPHRPFLDRTFEEMRELSRTHGFDVLVIVAPSAARLHGAAFDDFPELSAEPYFADYVIELAARQGFATLDLIDGMKPFAQTGLLYYRDDHHWNERGNEVAARLIGTALAGLPARSQ